MPKLVWDQTGEKLYETGVDRGVLYVRNSAGAYPQGVAWNGLTAVTESPSGAEATALYADNIKYLNLLSNEEFGATVEAYTYPDAFGECDGSLAIAAGVFAGQQTRKTFGLCYRTILGNDTDTNNYGYKIHIIYGATAAPSEKAYATVNDSPEAITFSWELSTTPVNVTGGKPTASITIDSTKVPAAKLAQLEDILYGTSSADARLPLPDEIATIIGTAGAYTITNYLTHVISSNEATTTTGNFTTTLSAETGYTLTGGNTIVLMGGADVTSTAYTSSTHKITIASVTGPIVIYATAVSA